MKRYAVLGAGLMGRVAARDLLETEADSAVTLVDSNELVLQGAVEFIGNERLTPVHTNVQDTSQTAAVLAGHDAVISALPHRFSLDGIEATLRARVPLVDMVGASPERRVALHARARDAGVLIVPGCGVAPGVSNVLVARGVELLEETEDAIIYVGGIPKERGGPLDYQTVYSLESMFAACERPATIWLEGVETTVEALTGIETVEFPAPIGKLEAYFTDGLASLPLTMEGRISGTLAEKTLRYPGFAERVRFLRDCGSLRADPIEVGTLNVVPREVLIALLTPILALGPEGDILVLRVFVRGQKDGRRRVHTFDLIDYFDPETGYTAMARTTAFPANCTARLIVAGKITETGVRFPEQIFVGLMGDEFLAALARHGLVVSHLDR